MNWEIFCLICLAVGLALPAEEGVRLRRGSFGDGKRPAQTAVRTRVARGKEDGR